MSFDLSVRIASNPPRAVMHLFEAIHLTGRPNTTVSEAKRELGWEPKIDLTVGLRHAVDKYRAEIASDRV
jgi:nucleoside-diphosphate-sugar epimerase